MCVCVRVCTGTENTLCVVGRVRKGRVGMWMVFTQCGQISTDSGRNNAMDDESTELMCASDFLLAFREGHD